MKWSPTRPAVVRGHVRQLGIGAVRVTFRWAPGETTHAARRWSRSGAHRRPHSGTSARARRLLERATGRPSIDVAAQRSTAPTSPACSRRAARERRRHLERAELAPLLAAAVRRRRRERRAARVRAAARRLLGRAPRRPARRERDRRLVRPAGTTTRRQAGPPTRRSRFYEELGARLPGERPRPADLRHGRPQPVPEHLRRAAVGQAPGRHDRRGRLREARLRADRRASRGTAQPVPGNGLSIWYMEDGFQTRVAPGRARFYAGRENDQWALDAVAPRAGDGRRRRPPSTRRPSSPTPCGSPTASRTSARSSTSCSPTSRSLGGLAVGPALVELAAEAVVPVPSRAPSRTSAAAGSTAPPTAGWADAPAGRRPVQTWNVPADAV